ncbi:AtpZ/AtpI family protein [Kordiimonas aquimaris]|uniref:AtpZ/AtpI family protein n=1 Tax=Kordiimonas aquimaris TaxID=707591 RepID=UPI0021CED4D7|nr:AtpZ/AtpI family protein [Kordiimonas aquimaris]
MGDTRKNPEEPSFDERLDRAQKKADDKPSFENAEDKSGSPMGIAFKMGIELVVGSGVGAFIGFWFDRWFDTKPVFLIVLLILGFASGIRNVIREANKMQDDNAD